MVPCLIEINPYLGEYHFEYKVHWVLKCPRIYSINLSKRFHPANLMKPFPLGLNWPVHTKV